jgi:hypothetical protein
MCAAAKRASATGTVQASERKHALHTALWHKELEIIKDVSPLEWFEAEC